MDYTVADYYKEMVAYYYRADCFHTMRNPDQDATSGNHHVINATHHLILKKNLGYSIGYDGQVSGGSYDEVMEMLENEAIASKSFIESTRNKYGWFDRHPKKMGDRQSHDDIIGIFVSSRILELKFALEIYNKGVNKTKGKLFGIPFSLRWYYTNQDDMPNLRLNAWHGRFPWLIAFYDASIKHEVNAFQALGYSVYLLADVLFNKNKQATSGRILKWLMNDTMKNKNFILDWAINKWEKNIEKMYPDGKMGEVLGIYHGKQHPFSRIMWSKM